MLLAETFFDEKTGGFYQPPNLLAGTQSMNARKRLDAIL